MSFRYGLLIAATLALVGCQRAAVVTVPKVVVQTVKEYVAVPESMTTPCPIPLQQNRSVEEAVRIARARRASLIDCNKQLEKIRNLPAHSGTDQLPL